MRLNVQDNQLDMIASFCGGDPSFDMEAWICAVQTLQSYGVTRTDFSVFD